MGEVFQQIGAIFQKLFNSAALIELLKEPGMFTACLIAVTLVVFVETGLMVGFFLPGDSLLVSIGLVAYAADWSLPVLMLFFCVAAVVGDSVGYWIGLKTGPKIFSREESFLFKKAHLLKAQEFYEKHGGKTIILARFMPIVRTFAPVVAGVGKMNYRQFLTYNVIGGVAWVVSMLLLGYALTPMIDPPLKKVFGEQFQVLKYIEVVIILVVLLSISPGIYAWWRARSAKKKAEKTTTVLAA